MKQAARKNNYFPAIVIFIGFPLLLYTLGNYPRRTILKESLSILFILSFSLMLGQFFLARSYKITGQYIKMSTVLKIHKAIGYIFVSALLVHPFLIVVPRYFESGIDPVEAFLTIVTTTDNTSIVLGIISWSLLLLLGVTSLSRNKLPIKYKTWRILHGVIAILFIAISTWHATDLGRHTDMAMSVYMISLAAGGVLLLLKVYFCRSSEPTGDN